MFRKLKIQVFLVAMAAIVLTLFTQKTLAYYSVIGTATNVVTSGDIDLKIHEKTAGGADFPSQGVYVIPGDVVSKIVTVENVCNHPFYLRVKLINGTTDTELTVEDCLKIELNLENWVLRDDGFLYYERILEPGEATEPVFTEVEIIGDKITQHHAGNILSVTVAAHAVQSENNPADHPWTAAGWPMG